MLSKKEENFGILWRAIEIILHVSVIHWLVPPDCYAELERVSYKL